MSTDCSPRAILPQAVRPLLTLLLPADRLDVTKRAQGFSPLSLRLRYRKRWIYSFSCILRLYPSDLRLSTGAPGQPGMPPFPSTGMPPGMPPGLASGMPPNMGPPFGYRTLLPQGMPPGMKMPPGMAGAPPRGKQYPPFHHQGLRALHQKDSEIDRRQIGTYPIERLTGVTFLVPTENKIRASKSRETLGCRVVELTER